MNVDLLWRQVPRSRLCHSIGTQVQRWVTPECSDTHGWCLGVRFWRAAQRGRKAVRQPCCSTKMRSRSRHPRNRVQRFSVATVRHATAATVVETRRGPFPHWPGGLESYLAQQMIDFVNLDRDVPEMHRIFASKDLNATPGMAGPRRASLAPASRTSSRKSATGRLSWTALTRTPRTAQAVIGARVRGMNDGFVPALRSQHYAYLLLQLRQFDAERRLNLHPVLLEHMVDLGPEDMEEAMADYLSRRLPLTKAPAGPAARQPQKEE